MAAALPSEELSRLPETSRKYFETREKIEGELEVIAECEEHKGRIEYFVKQGDSRLPLFLAGEPDSKFVSGKKVTVDAVKLDDTLVANPDSIKSTEAATPTQSAALPNTTGEKRVLVILVNFQDKQTQPFTTEQARDVTFNQTSNYFYENSYGRTWLTGDVYGWYTIPVSSTGCDMTTIASYANQAAANAGANLAAYDHWVYAFPSNACGFTGRASVGGSTTGQVWVNEWFELGILGHELGHNLGLYHSRSMDCGSAAIGGSCTTSEYGDQFDIMGTAGSAHLNPFQKERLGWLQYAGTPTAQTISASGTYWIDAYEPNGASFKVLKILKSIDPTTGARTWYYVERRTTYGFNSYLTGNTNVLNGVLIRTGSETSGQETYLLDMTPETTAWWDPALTVGRTFNDPGTGTAVTPISVDNSGAWVQVSVPITGCTRAIPTVTVTPGQSNWLSRGSTFGYQVFVTNNNASGCAPEAFNLSASLPASLSASFSAPSLNLSSGTTNSVVLNVTSSLTAADGVYNFAANASNGAYSGSAAASYVVASGLSVIASPGASSYSRSQTASVTATVTAGGSPLAGASVTFTMTKSNSATVTKAVVTGNDGRAIFSYKFNRKSDPAGTYTVRAVAASNGYSGQATTSFSVTK
jgi:hypothetical protein